ncbi:unnamed protein product [Protopolystoma xenopodis]|uniref:Uncharacterized protein n=1 Tax=Protopolystoma xenopodis TaxID=117903 RepID=A0A3S5AJ72_9PLAT|nr:unnamed protein product [Protopolystoma xenopodis]
MGAVRLLLTLPSRTYTNILEGSPATHTLPISIPPQGSTYFMSPMTPCHQLHSTNAQLPLTPQQQSFLSPKPQRMLQTPVSASRRRFFPSLRVHREVNTESEASVN